MAQIPVPVPTSSTFCGLFVSSILISPYSLCR